MFPCEALDVVRRKPTAIISVPDGAGRMAPVIDRRFQKGNWPVQFEISPEEADIWTRYLVALCEEKSWSWNAVSQHERHDTSGTVTINRGAGATSLAVVWDRRRDKAMTIRAGWVGPTELQASE